MSGLEKYSGILALIVLLAILVVYIRYKANHTDDEVEEEEKPVVRNVVNNVSPLNLDDEDATVAALIAAIECRNETKKDVRVISVKEI